MPQEPAAIGPHHVLRDRLVGIAVAVFGAAVVLYARTFPPMPGQRIGPALFPTIIGMLLAALGLALAVARARPGASAPGGATRAPAAARTAWRRFAAVAGVLLGYAVAVDWLGFMLTAIAFLATLMLVFGVRRRWILPIAVAVTLAIHYGFYTVLRVPLPWGLLDAVAW